VSASLVVELVGVRADWGVGPFDATLHRGELVALQGRSGSGKSTLLAMLAGWYPPDGGSIEWAPGAGSASWSSTAIVPQVLGLADELSIAENLAHVLRLGGRRDWDVAVATMLDALDLTEQAPRLARDVSLGQQQRAAVGRAAIIEPRLLLADEPTCHQDPAHVDAVLAVLRAAVDRGGAVLVASHDPVAAATADRVISLD
jgi:ABC-type lipoprotein export system ATPase subunit